MATKSGWNVLMEAMADSYIQEIEADCTTDFEPSKKHLAWVNRHIYKKRRLFSGKLARCAALFALVCLLSFGLAMTVEAAREYVQGFFTEIFGEWLHVSHREDVVLNSPETIEKQYLPTYLPDGYVIQEQKERTTFVTTIWTSPDGKTIQLGQWVLRADINFKAHNTVEVQIGDVRALYQTSGNKHVYYWSTEEYQFWIELTEAFSEEVIEAIIQSIS